MTALDAYNQINIIVEGVGFRRADENEVSIHGLYYVCQPTGVVIEDRLTQQFYLEFTLTLLIQEATPQADQEFLVIQTLGVVLSNLRADGRYIIDDVTRVSSRPNQSDTEVGDTFVQIEIRLHDRKTAYG